MKKNFRFYDNRQKYLLFVTTTNEKNQIADAIRPHVNKIKPQKPGLKISFLCFLDIALPLLEISK